MKPFRRLTLLFFLPWLLVLQAVAKEEERSFVVISATSGLADNSSQIVKCTKTGRLIISTIGNLNFYDGKNFTHADVRPDVEYPLPLYHGHYHLYFDRQHHIWLKDKRKVMCLNLMTERYIENVDSVIRAMGCNEIVLDLFGDQNGNMWFVTGRGLFSPEQNITLPMRRGHRLQDVDVHGNMTFLFYDNGDIVGFDERGNMACNVQAYDWDTIGKKYAGSSVLQPYGDGFFQIRNGDKGAILLFFNAVTFQCETVFTKDYHLNNLTVDTKNEKLYIPCEYGYWIYQPSNHELEWVPELLLTNGQLMATDCNAMAFDHQGGLWIGTEKRGVLYARPHSLSFRSYAWGHELATKYAIMMDSLDQNITEFNGQRANYKVQDSRGWTWIGTRQGVFIEQPGVPEPKHFGRAQGMNNAVVHALVEDAEHNMWASTSSGITFFKVKNGEVVFVNNFTGSDNVPSESFANGKALLLADSTIVMQGIEHVVAFKPSDLYEVNEPRLVTNIKPKLVHMLVNGNMIEPGIAYDGNIITDRSLTRTEHINLKSDQNNINLVFSALNYFRPMQTYYRVRVYELDKEWKTFSCYTTSMVDSQGMLHFPIANLKPGSYRVEVQSSMFPDMWQENIPYKDRFIWKIHVKQPWWRTTGLLVLLGLVLLTLLVINFFIYNGNTRMRERRNNTEGDIIRKIRFFAQRCEGYANQPLAPTFDDLLGKYSSAAQAPLSKEFIDLMLKIMPYIASSNNRDLTMRKLSETGGMDIQHLYEVVMENLYKNPRDLALLIKLRKAAQLLQTTEKTVEEVADECGFYTPNYLMGSFFHIYKQTPLEYRQTHQA